MRPRNKFTPLVESLPVRVLPAATVDLGDFLSLQDETAADGTVSRL